MLNIDGEESFEPDYLEDIEICDEEDNMSEPIRKVKVKSTSNDLLVEIRGKSVNLSQNRSNPHAQKRRLRSEDRSSDEITYSKLKISRYDPDTLHNGGEQFNISDDLVAADDIVLEGDGILIEELVGDGSDVELEELSDKSKDDEFVLFCDANDCLNEEDELASLDNTNVEPGVLSSNDCRRPKGVAKVGSKFTHVSREKPIEAVPSDAFKKTEIRKSFEEKFEMAIKNKNWKSLEKIFEDCSMHQDLKEKLYFLCADLLASPTEFSDIIKHFQKASGLDKIGDILTLMGSKLIINADLCKNFKAGVIILKLMMDANLWFHCVYTRTFYASDVIKSATQCCLQEKQYALISGLVKGADFFTPPPSNAQRKVIENINSTSVAQLYNLNVILQHVTHHLGSSDNIDGEPLEFFNLTSICLQIMKMFLEIRKRGTRKKISFFFQGIKDLGSKAWVLMKIFVAKEMIDEVGSLIDLSVQYENLITWSLLRYGTIISFFLHYSKDDDKSYECGIRFINILNREDVLPAFVEFARLKKEIIIKFYTSMTQDEMRLFLNLFIKSVIRCKEIKSKAIYWNICIVDKDCSLDTQPQASALLECVLRKYFPHLEWIKTVAGYSVNYNYCEQRGSNILPNSSKDKPPMKNIRSLLDIKIPTQFINKIERCQLDKKNSVPQISGTYKSKGESKVHQQCDATVIEDIHVSQPTFYWAAPPTTNQSSEKHTHNVTGPLPPVKTHQTSLIARPFQPQNHLPVGVMDHPRFHLPNSHVSHGSTIRSKLHDECQSCATSFRAASTNSNSSDVFKRMEGDIFDRLTFYISDGRLLPHEADDLLRYFSDKMFRSLHQDRNGRFVYDDGAFEQLQEHMDYVIADILQNKYL